MGTFALVVRLFAALGGFNPHFRLLPIKPGAYLKGWVKRVILFSPLIAGYLVVFTPALTGPLWGVSRIIILVAVINLAISAMVYKENPEDDFERAMPDKGVMFLIGVVPIVCLFLLVSVRWISGWELFRAGSYRALAGEVETREWSKDMSPVDTKHIRMVSLEQARWLGDKVLGEAGALGSQFQPGRYHIQRVQGHLYWVAPLIHHGFLRWWSNEVTEGFIMVSAEDNTAHPKLITKKKMRYIPSGYWGSNLERHLYINGYVDGNYHIHFEVDEDLNPYYVVTMTQPTIGYSGEKISRVLVINPETGQIDPYTLENLPAWVDLAVPQALAVQYLNWWGEYAHGWMNSHWGSGKDVTKLTWEGMSMVWGSDDEPYWFAGMTSKATTDAALTGLAYVDSRTGKIRLYPSPGYAETAVMQTVNAAVSNFRGYHATPPILYPLYGEKVWAVPVVSDNHIFQRLALVRNTDSAVALGNDRETALREFKKFLTASGNEIVPEERAKLQRLTLVLDRVSADVQNGSTVYYLYAKDHKGKVFTGTSIVSAAFPLARPGDKVSVSYLETTEHVVPVRTFAIEGIPLNGKPAKKK